MEEGGGKVRLVRCPKCENLLPELADFSVYQCGGCGAVLRGKNKSSVANDLSDKSGEEKIENGSQNSVTLPEKTVPNAVDASDAGMKLDTMRHDRSALENDEFRGADKYKYLAEDTVEKRTFEGDCDMKKYKGLGDIDMRTELRKVKPVFESVGTSRVPERYQDWRKFGRNEMDGNRNLMSDVKDAKFSSSNYLNEGPSNYHPGLSCGYAEQTQLSSNADAPSKVEYLEQDRAELLRKLDELKAQLSRSCDVADNPKDNASLDRKSGSQQSYGNPKTWSLGGSSMPNRDSMQFPMPRERITDPPYLNRYPEPYPHRQEMAMPNIFPPTRDSSHFHMYGDPYESRMHRRPMHQVPGQYNETSRPFISGQYMDNDLKPFEPYPYNSAFHHPSCTCFHCYSTRQYVPQPIPPATFNDRRFQDIANDPMFYHRENHPPYTSHAYNPTPLSSRGAVPIMKGASDFNSEEGSYLPTRPQRVLDASGRVCYPVAGGAPFITCCNCFELLYLPENALNNDKKLQSLRCGACSAIITYALIDKKLVLSVNREKRQISDEANDSSSEMMRGKKSDFHAHMKHGGASYSFNDYDNGGYEFESLDREPIILSSGHVSNSSKQQDMQSYDTSSPGTSDDENSPDVSALTREEKHSAEQPVKASLSPPPAGSPLQEYIDYSNYNNRVNRFGKGNQSSRSDHENLGLNKPTTRQNSVKEAAVATEMDVSYNEFSNTGVSQESADGSREYNRRRVGGKGNESFLATFIKKSFSRSSQPADSCKEYVSINGHLISDRLVKKAEKLAGPIRPGQYWYDARAGFWGVMGGPCLGIIPPSIEEFNFQMSEDCAGGDTGVFVNGRELHKKDLDLLVSRGLPTERDRSYIIDISGRVWDEDTGKEQDCLGRLAPTVEKVKHGFGMKVPRTSA